MQVILVRHGETEHNTKDSITGQMDISLNKYGVEQAEKAAERLENVEFDAAYSSDLERTYETTRIIAENMDFTRKDTRSSEKEVSENMKESRKMTGEK